VQKRQTVQQEEQKDKGIGRKGGFAEKIAADEAEASSGIKRAVQQLCQGVRTSGWQYGFFMRARHLQLG
jgi:hypothetical protein